MVKLPPLTSTAGQTPRSPRQPDMVQTIQAGTIKENKTNCRPAIWLIAISEMPVTLCSVVIGMPKPPKATGAVLAIRASPAARIGRKPVPMRIAAETATGAPKPAAPSKNAPKLKAISRAWIRRSGDSAVTENLTTSKWPVSTVRQ